MVRALAAALFALLAPPALAEAPGPDGIQIAYLNRTWSDLVQDAIPVVEGPLSVQLRSPENHVTVHRNRLVLAPRDGGDLNAQIEAEFEGEGRLVAEIGGGRFDKGFAERVRAPRQSVRVAGRARVTRDADAYELTLLGGPESAPVEIRSDAITHVLELCEKIDRLAGLDCGRLRRSLTSVRVPLGGGERALRLPRERLAAEERAYLDRFVAP